MATTIVILDDIQILIRSSEKVMAWRSVWTLRRHDRSCEVDAEVISTHQAQPEWTCILGTCELSTAYSLLPGVRESKRQAAERVLLLSGVWIWKVSMGLEDSRAVDLI